MKTPAWSEEEIADLERLTQSEWLAKHPQRTQRAYAVEMNRVGLRVGTNDAVVKERRRLLYGIEDQPEPDPLVVLEAMKQLQAETRKLLAGNSDVEIGINTSRPIGVCFMSDWHIGGEGVDYGQLERDIETVRQCPYLYCYVGGDAVDNFILERMMAASRSQIAQVPVQWFLFEHFLKKMQGSILAVGAGNHDNWVKQLTGIDRMAQIAKELKLVYTAMGGLIRLHVGQQEYRIYRRHKYRYWSSLNPLYSVKRLYDLGECTFDVGVIEHKHLGVAEVFQRHGTDRIAIVCGTYKVVDEYARDIGFFGSHVSNPVVLFWPDERRYELRFNLESAVAELCRM